MQRGRDLSTLSNAYLKALITEHGYSHDGLLTREELVARAEEAATTPDLPPLEGDEDGTAPWREVGLRGKCLGEPIRTPQPGHAGLPAHASAIGNLAVHQFPERLAPSPPGTPLYAAAAAHHRRQHRLG